MDILLCEWIFELQYCLSVWHNECCDLGHSSNNIRDIWQNNLYSPRWFWCIVEVYVSCIHLDWDFFHPSTQRGTVSFPNLPTALPYSCCLYQHASRLCSYDFAKASDTKANHLYCTIRHLTCCCHIVHFVVHFKELCFVQRLSWTTGSVWPAV